MEAVGAFFAASRGFTRLRHRPGGPCQDPGVSISTRLPGALIRCALIISALFVFPATSGAAPSERPIVYAVVVDGLDGDAVDSGQAPFISSLLDGGANTQYYQESRSVMVAETNPNHTAMMTGRYTENSGIAGNTFAIYAPLEGEEDNEADSCTRTGPRDPRSLPTETSGENADCILGETVFEAIRRQGNPDKLTTAAVMGKAKLGRIFNGMTPKGGRFVSHIWAPCTPSDGPEEEEYCDNVPIEPITMDRTIADSFVMDEVLRTIDEGVGPRSERPDFTFVNLPNVDNSGHAFGGGSLPYNAAVGLADLEIRRLVDRLKERGEWERTILVILSDHAHDSTPQVSTLTSELEDGGISPDEFLIVDNGNVDMLYLADRKSDDRHELLARMREIILNSEGVDQALYRKPNPADGGKAHTLDGSEPDWFAAGTRTGDLFVTARPGRRFSDPSPLSNPLPGNHGGWHTRDNTFLISSGGNLVVDRNRAGQVADRFSDAALNPKQAENVDLASTVLGALGLLETRGNAGRYLGEALVEKNLPGAAESSISPVLKSDRYSKRGKLNRYFLRWGAAGKKSPRRTGGEWTLQLRKPGEGWKTLLKNKSRQSSKVKVRAGSGRFQVRVRARTPAGVKTTWTKLKLR